VSFLSTSIHTSPPSKVPLLANDLGCLAVILLVLTLTKIILHWQERAEAHSTLLGENISLVRQADDLLLSTTEIPETVQIFLRVAERSEIADRQAVGELPEVERQFAYREGLKELEPGNVSIVCPKCGSSLGNLLPVHASFVVILQQVNALPTTRRHSKHDP
jgi:hypothetical protein